MKTKIFLLLLLSILIIDTKGQICVKSSGMVRVGGGTTNPSATLEVQEYNKTTEARIFATTENIARLWTMNQTYAYGFGVDASGIGHIYHNVNSPSNIMNFNGDGQVSIGGNPYSTNIFTVNGNAYSTGGWYSPSDMRYKKNIKPINGALDKVLKIKGASYEYNREEYKNMNFKEGISLGFIAQDLKEILPEAVNEDSNGFYSINYDEVIPVLVEAIKEQQFQIDSLKKLVNLGHIGSFNNADISTSIESNNGDPNLASLQQNVPNPFNKTTNIIYYLPETIQDAALFIYDMQGIQIKSIPITTKGNGIITINGYELKAGMYIYTLIADNKEVSTKRMILTK